MAHILPEDFGVLEEKVVMGDIKLKEIEKLVNLFENTSLTEMKIVYNRVAVTMKKSKR